MRSLVCVVVILGLLVIPVTADFPVEGTFTALDSGVSESYSQFDGEVVLVEGFATWCEPCRSEMHELSRVQDVFGENLTILSLSVSPATDSLEKIEQFKVEAEEEFGFVANWKFGLSQGGEGGFAEVMDIEIIPTTIIIGSEGDVKQRWEGVVDASEIVSFLDGNITFPEDNPNAALITQLTNNNLFRIFALGTTMIAMYVIFVPRSADGKENS